MIECLRRMLASFSRRPEGYVPCAGDDLFASMRPRGIPTGDLTIQLLADLYLNAWDHRMQGRLGAGAYVGYLDDGMIIGGE